MNVELWFEYILRFSHLVAGIAWIGSSFYFIWLDSSFVPPETPRKNVDGELFMVHGGFYYQVEKKRIYPGELPKVLHWFKWEATLTWITGLILFFALYFLKGAQLLIDTQVSPLTQITAIILSLFTIIGSWLIYDLVLWNPKNFFPKFVSTILSMAFFAALTFGLTQTFSGRGAFILTGVVLGTLMVLNVWIRILPGQRKMLKDAETGRIPDYSLGLKSKVRSVHNTYFTFPVLFIMLSNHFPSVYSHKLNWLLLIVLSVSSAIVRHVMVSSDKKQRWWLAPSLIGLGFLLFVSAAPKGLNPTMSPVPFSSVSAIVSKRCSQCHSSANTDQDYQVAPKGVILETELQVRNMAPQIFIHVVQARTMPLGNKTGMSETEREVVAAWLKQQGLVQTP